MLETQQYALEFSKDVQNGKVDMIIARKKIWETTTIGLPQVNGNIEYQNILNIPTQLIPDFFSGNMQNMIPIQFDTKHIQFLGNYDFLN